MGDEIIAEKLFERHPSRRYEDNILYSETDLQDARKFTGKLVNEMVKEILDGNF